MTTENAVAPVEEHAVAPVQEPFDDGLGDMTEEDLIIPRLSINQPTTTGIEPADIGKLMVNLTGECNESMRIAIFTRNKSRTLFPEEYAADNKPLCRSFDNIKPAQIEGQEPMCDTCEKIPGERNKYHCPYANWGADNTPPRCQESIDLLIIDLDTYVPMYFSCRSTAFKPAKKILSALKLMAGAKRVMGCAFGITLSTEKFKETAAYIPVFGKPTMLDPDEIETLAGIYETLKGVTSAEDMSDSSQVDQAKPEEKEDEDF